MLLFFISPFYELCVWKKMYRFAMIDNGAPPQTLLGE